jgi:L-lactate dehydrogenase (cytochrome)
MYYLLLISLITVLKDEMEMNMRLIGARTLDELDESMVDTRALSTHIGI